MKQASKASAAPAAANELTLRMERARGDEYDELLAEGIRYASKQNYRKSAKKYHDAIAVRPDRPTAYFNLGGVLYNSGLCAEAAQRFIEATQRVPEGSEKWAEATAWAFGLLRQPDCDEVAKPAWWNDGDLKTLSARVVRAAPNCGAAHIMRARVLSGASLA